MEYILGLVIKSMGQVWLTLLHNWPYLLLSVVIATLLKLYVNSEQVSALLKRYRGAGVVAATAASVATPLCSCGTTAVILGMMASHMSWAPIIAFMVASPLTSPQELIYSAGLFGWPFAWAFFLASILLGLVGGWVAALLENRGWLANQARFAEVSPAPCDCSANTLTNNAADRMYSLDIPLVKMSNAETSCGCAEPVLPGPATACGCAQAKPVSAVEEPGPGCACGSSLPVQSESEVLSQQPKVSLVAFLTELYRSGVKLLVMFLGFAFVGYFLNGLIPAGWVAALFGGGHVYNVPLAASLGLPFYINSEASLPLVRTLLDAGMSQGAALAFMIAGAGTSIGAISGALTIARWRVVALVVGILWAGAILSGFAFNLWLAAQLV
jgi:uncharacterized protein